MICRQCWNADAIIDMLVCVRCYDRNNPTDAVEEGKAVRRGEVLKAREEEPWEEDLVASRS